MIDDPKLDAFVNKVRALKEVAIPAPWDHTLVDVRFAGPHTQTTLDATKQLVLCAPEMVEHFAALDRVAELEERVAELEAELDGATTDTFEEVARLTEENDRLRAEVARLTAALNGTLVDGEPK